LLLLISEEADDGEEECAHMCLPVHDLFGRLTDSCFVAHANVNAGSSSRKAGKSIF
jgi:hypothetical protein